MAVVVMTLAGPVQATHNSNWDGAPFTIGGGPPGSTAGAFYVCQHPHSPSGMGVGIGGACKLGGGHQFDDFNVRVHVTLDSHDPNVVAHEFTGASAFTGFQVRCADLGLLDGPLSWWRADNPDGDGYASFDFYVADSGSDHYVPGCQHYDVMVDAGTVEGYIAVEACGYASSCPGMDCHWDGVECEFS